MNEFGQMEVKKEVRDECDPSEFKNECDPLEVKEKCHPLDGEDGCDPFEVKDECDPLKVKEDCDTLEVKDENLLEIKDNLLLMTGKLSKQDADACCAHHCYCFDIRSTCIQHNGF